MMLSPEIAVRIPYITGGISARPYVTLALFTTMSCASSLIDLLSIKITPVNVGYTYSRCLNQAYVHKHVSL